MVACGSGRTWTKALCFCVPNAIVRLREFHEIVVREKSCPGTEVGSPQALERLRFCSTVEGPLVLANLAAGPAPLDTSPLRWIRSINGAHSNQC